MPSYAPTSRDVQERRRVAALQVKAENRRHAGLQHVCDFHFRFYFKSSSAGRAKSASRAGRPSKGKLRGNLKDARSSRTGDSPKQAAGEGPAGVVELRVVKGIESFEPYLQFHAFQELRVFMQATTPHQYLFFNKYKGG